jgi:hypothetical protein
MENIYTCKHMNVPWIFFDQSGHDFEVSRERRNEAVVHTHESGMSLFMNLFNPDNIFGGSI